MSPSSFRVLCVCQSGDLRASLNDFIAPIIRNIGGAVWADDVAEAKSEIVQQLCPYDCVLVPMSVPGAFASEAPFPRVPSLSSGECIAIAALRANPNVRCIIMPMTKGQTSHLGHIHKGIAEGRLYVAAFGSSWLDAFVASNLFPTIVDELGLAAVSS